ncbi:hypothetical protein F5148DRAFT_1149029 [Russula earlei]|uniref:Uncharacterized protein n=1 Tax=Russula earlei TaxID=71964 RepID=A0ACC0UAA9_9AGAM|nr:hypothetical protein F5148DRAFT_1149029 [Russula earlei]
MLSGVGYRIYHSSHRIGDLNHAASAALDWYDEYIPPCGFELRPFALIILQRVMNGRAQVLTGVVAEIRPKGIFALMVEDTTITEDPDGVIERLRTYRNAHKRRDLDQLNLENGGVVQEMGRCSHVELVTLLWSELDLLQMALNGESRNEAVRRAREFVTDPYHARSFHGYERPPIYYGAGEELTIEVTSKDHQKCRMPVAGGLCRVISISQK